MVQRKSTVPTAQPAPTNKLPQRVADYRAIQWRKWAARELMAHPERNQRVMIALALSGRAADVRSAEFARVVGKITGDMKETGFSRFLPKADAIDARHLERLILAMTASAAFGVGLGDLNALLNYLQVDERQHFKWSAEFLELFTLSELDSLASEVGLKQKMGVTFKSAREKKKGGFRQQESHHDNSSD